MMWLSQYVVIQTGSYLPNISEAFCLGTVLQPLFIGKLNRGEWVIKPEAASVFVS